MNFTGERFILLESNEKDEIYIEHLMRYKSVSEIVKDKIVLDAATGDGYGAFILSSHAKKITGIDISNESINYAKNNYYNNNLDYLQSSIEKLPFEDSTFDVIISFETIEHVDINIQNKFFAEIKRVLRDNGILIISTPDKKYYSDIYNYKNEFHIKEFYEEEWNDFISNYFSNTKTFYQKTENAHIITSKYSENSRIFDNNSLNHGKYLISICSESFIDNIDISYFNVLNDTYDTNILRIIELQNQLEEQNAWALRLKNELDDKNKVLMEISEWATKLNNRLNKIENNFILKIMLKFFIGK